MSIKKEFYKLNKTDFNLYLDGLKNSKETKFFLNRAYFFYPSTDVNNSIIELNKLQWEFDNIMTSYSLFGQKKIIEKFFLDEIESTNKIENIFSTRKDIFSILNKISKSKDKKIISIVNSYKLLLENKSNHIDNLSDIRKIYDLLLKDAIEKEDLPDGKYFRKNSVHITDGLKTIHEGMIGEDNINNSMKEFIELYNLDMEIYQKMILCHFIIETIHPFYDGNGRLGRFLFSNGLYEATNSIFAFIVSKAFSDSKDRYYQAFKEARDIHEFGCLNDFVISFIEILKKELILVKSDLLKKKEQIEKISVPSSLTKSQKQIFSLICEASILSEYGISNEELMQETSLSKRTIIYGLNSFKEKGILTDTKIGKITFHKIV